MELRPWVRPLIRVVATVSYPVALLVGGPRVERVVAPALGWIVGRYGFRVCPAVRPR